MSKWRWSESPDSDIKVEVVYKASVSTERLTDNTTLLD